MNRGPADYESAALPLSYAGVAGVWFVTRRREHRIVPEPFGFGEQRKRVGFGELGLVDDPKSALVLDPQRPPACGVLKPETHRQVPMGYAIVEHANRKGLGRLTLAENEGAGSRHIVRLSDRGSIGSRIIDADARRGSPEARHGNGRGSAPFAPTEV